MKGSKDLKQELEAFQIIAAGGTNILGEIHKSPSGEIVETGITSVHDRSTKISKDTIVGIGSIGKQHTAATLLKLWDQELSDRKSGKIDEEHFVDEEGNRGINVKLKKFLPALKEKYPDCLNFFSQIEQYDYFDQITLADLLNHTHGLGARDNAQMTKLILESEGNPLSLSDIVKSSHKRTYQEVGSVKGEPQEIADRYGQMCYGNLGYDLAAMVVEVVTGKEFDQVVKDALLEPHELSSTTTQSDHLELYDSGRFRGEEVDVARGFHLEGGVEIDYNKLTNTRGAGGMKSTIADLEKFGRLYMSGDMFENEEVKQAARVDDKTPVENMYTTEKSIYHLAIEVGGDGRLGHHGNDTVFESDLRYDPKTGETEIMLQVIENLTHNIARKAFLEIYGEERAGKLDSAIVDSGFFPLFHSSGRPKPGSEKFNKIASALILENPDLYQILSDYGNIKQEIERRSVDDLKERSDEVIKSIKSTLSVAEGKDRHVVRAGSRRNIEALDLATPRQDIKQQEKESKSWVEKMSEKQNTSSSKDGYREI